MTAGHRKPIAVPAWARTVFTGWKDEEVESWLEKVVEAKKQNGVS
jgi:hypothetical protein